MREHIGWSCSNCEIAYSLRRNTKGVCPNCGGKMNKSHSLTEEELADLGYPVL